MAFNQSPLHEICLQAGGKMIPFAGWEMPIQFSGLLNEHKAVRTNAGLFDISHMGVLLLEGTNPKDALQTLVPSDLHRIGPGEACYTVLLNENAGIIDDLIVYDLGKNKQNKESILLIINAACFIKDKEWIKRHLEPKEITIRDGKRNKILLALQGPQAISIMNQFTDEKVNTIPVFGHKRITLKDLDKTHNSIFLARTGYTGEDGFELLLSKEIGYKLWNQLIKSGVTPCGLGARDTLRLEAGMHLYGNEINSQTTPLEAGLSWLVHLEMPSQFFGRKILEQQTQNGLTKQLIGIEVEGRAIARKGCTLFHNETSVGAITSGSWSPTLKKAIGMAYVKKELAKADTRLLVEIREKKHPAKVVKRPFYRKTHKN